tara:strand:- start:5384 stop:5566 length:183 start_codon:yes stop_codon:yes gene_type:complete
MALQMVLFFLNWPWGLCAMGADSQQCEDGQELANGTLCSTVHLLGIMITEAICLINCDNL